MLKLLHTADIHTNKTRSDDVCKLIDFYIKEIKEKDINAVLISGDFWDCAVVNNKEFAKVIAKMSALIQLVPVYMIYGTPSHEVSGSLELFKELGACVASEPELWTLSNNKGECIDILGVPEPRRSSFIAKSIEETDTKINKYLHNTFNIEHDNPLVVMWHGETDGVCMDNGILSKSNTRLTKSIYSQCNPIYIAAGHIHLSQTVGKIVRYSGSPIPVTFGELHKPSYSLVTIKDGKATCEEISLPFSQNKVIECDFDMFSKLSALNFKDSNVKIKLTLTSEQRKTFRVKDEAAKLKERTNATNVVINISTAKEVSIRSKEIIKTTSISEKLKIYAEVNGIELNDSLKQKAKDIEDSMLIKYIYPTHSFELLSLSLRGAKGLMGREEFNIDFTQYQDGIIALIGSNGSGKTTLLENMSPYPKLLTRSGALRSHFYLKDSHRIVTYRDENNKYYRFTIQLAAHIDSGLCKYFAETSDDEGKTWQKVEGIDGNIDVYTEYVTNLMGSVEMYLRTAFFTKGKVKGVNDIASATKGERIALISELLGTDTLSDMHDLIKDKLKEISNEMTKYENIEQKKEECESSISLKKTNEKRLEKELKEVEEALSYVEQEIAETKKAEEDFNKQFAKFGNAIQIKTEYEDRLVQLTSHLNNLKEHKKQNDFYNLHSKQIEEYKGEYKKAEPINKEIIEASDKLQKATTELINLTNEFNEVKSTLSIEQSKYDSTDERIKNTEENLICIDDNCPTCGAKLSEKRRKNF